MGDFLLGRIIFPSLIEISFKFSPNVGVSNFNATLMKKLLEAVTVKPAVNQVCLFASMNTIYEHPFFVALITFRSRATPIALMRSRVEVHPAWITTPILQS
jgi:hypothetical protein